MQGSEVASYDRNSTLIISAVTAPRDEAVTLGSGLCEARS
jgi:hypothetical protein